MKIINPKHVRRYIGIILLHFVQALCRVLPYTVVKYLGILLGDIAYFFSSHRKALARVNLELILGKDKRKLARKVMQHLGISLVEFLSLPYLKPDKLRRFCLIKGKEYLEQALKEGKGVVLLTAHFGNWELIGARLALEGFKAISLARPQGKFEKYIEKIRKKLGYKTVSTSNGILSLFSYLKEGAAVAILSDQNILFGGVIVPFFGIPVSSPPGTAILSLRSGAPVVPIFDVRVGKNHIIHIQPPIRILPNGHFRENVIKYTKTFNEIIEYWVRKYPEQWLWIHNRWRRVQERT